MKREEEIDGIKFGIAVFGIEETLTRWSHTEMWMS
jgi:hypothetical protein